MKVWFLLRLSWRVVAPVTSALPQGASRRQLCDSLFPARFVSCTTCSILALSAVVLKFHKPCPMSRPSMRPQRHHITHRAPQHGRAAPTTATPTHPRQPFFPCVVGVCVRARMRVYVSLFSSLALCLCVCVWSRSERTWVVCSSPWAAPRARRQAVVFPTRNTVSGSFTHLRVCVCDTFCHLLYAHEFEVCCVYVAALLLPL